MGKKKSNNEKVDLTVLDSVEGKVSSRRLSLGRHRVESFTSLLGSRVCIRVTQVPVQKGSRGRVRQSVEGTRVPVQWLPDYNTTEACFRTSFTRLLDARYFYLNWKFFGTNEDTGIQKSHRKISCPFLECIFHIELPVIFPRGRGLRRARTRYHRF